MEITFEDIEDLYYCSLCWEVLDEHEVNLNYCDVCAIEVEKTHNLMEREW